MLRQEDHQVQGLPAPQSKFKDILNNLLRLKIKRELGAKRKKRERTGVSLETGCWLLGENHSRADSDASEQREGGREEGRRGRGGGRGGREGEWREVERKRTEGGKKGGREGG